MTLDRRDLLKRSAILTAGITAGIAAGVNSVAAQDTEMQLWDTLNGPPRLEIADNLAASFSESHEGVTVEHRGWSLDELQKTLPRSVEGNQGPAVAQINNGEALMGPMVRAGQVISLAAYAEEYGWADKVPAGLMARNMYSPDGKTFGEGEIFGVSAETEIVGFYYNRSIFADNGIEVPETFEDFETMLATLKDAGVTPIIFGNLDKWQAIHLFGDVQGAYTTREYLDNLIYRRGEVSFEDQSMLDAATKLADWKEAGYFLDGFEGLNGDDAIPVFTGGAGAMLMQGSWAAGTVTDGLGDDAGFFLLPKRAEGDPVLHVGGVGIPYGITSNAADRDLAAELVNHMVSEESFNMFLDAGILPAGEIPADRIVEGTVQGDMYAAWNAALADDAIGHYLDWAAPGFYDVITAGLQELLGGEKTPEEFTKALQEAYAASFEG